MSRSPGSLLAIVVLSVTFVARSSASTVTVPDHFPTIQLALDSGADTVRVRMGHYAERPVVNSVDKNRVVEGIPEDGVRPSSDGLDIDPGNTEIFVHGFAFTRPVDLRSGGSLARVTFEECTLDSGLVYHIGDTADYEYVAILRSRIRGNVSLPAFTSVCEADTFESCGVRFDEESAAQVRNCVFNGPAAITGAAIRYFGQSGGTFVGNRIDRYATGISSGGLDAAMIVESNRIEHCSVGIDVANENEDAVRNNWILDCGTGITAASSGSLILAGNVVVNSTDIGIDLFAYNATNTLILGNVVGRSGSHGIRMESFSSSGATLRNNTSYRNGGAGIHARSNGESYDLLLSHNIGFENGTYGVDADTSAVPDSCNDWYGNPSGSTRGVTLSGTDLSVDPLFCDVNIDSVALSAKSPVLDAAGCGLIGARGVGCAITPTLVSLFTAERDAHGVSVRWRFAEPTRFAAVWVERADLLAGPWKAIAMERATEGDLYLAFDRDASAERGYWYRLMASEGGEAFVLGEPIAIEASAGAAFHLVGVSPNPGAGTQLVRFTLAHGSHVELDVFDVQGRHVATLVRGTLPAGSHVAAWSGRANVGTAPGLHFLRYRHPGGEQTLRFTRLH